MLNLDVNGYRHLLGEDLGPLSVKELQNLEKQLEGSLSQARQRKVLHLINCVFLYTYIDLKIFLVSLQLVRNLTFFIYDGRVV